MTGQKYFNNLSGPTRCRIHMAERNHEPMEEKRRVRGRTSLSLNGLDKYHCKRPRLQKGMRKNGVVSSERLSGNGSFGRKLIRRCWNRIMEKQTELSNIYFELRPKGNDAPVQVKRWKRLIQNQVKLMKIYLPYKPSDKSMTTHEKARWKLFLDSQRKLSATYPIVTIPITVDKVVKGHLTLREKLKAQEDSEMEDDIRVAFRKAYSSAFVSARSVTSNNTLDKLEVMSTNELFETLETIEPKNKEKKRELFRIHKRRSRHFYLQLRAGFSVLLYGLGSKKNLMKRFAREWLSDGPVIVINGYCPTLNLKGVLNCILKDVLKHELKPPESVLQQVELIRKILVPVDIHIYIVINSIDGVALRTKEDQSVLSCLASIPAIHMVASIDHIYAPMLWNLKHASEFKWLAHDVTTYEAYTEETQFIGNIMKSRFLAHENKIADVLKSLTPNHSEIMTLLASEQLERHPNGLEFASFFKRCISACLVTNQIQMRSHISELEDHELIHKKKMNGVMLYYIPYRGNVIRNKILKNFTII